MKNFKYSLLKFFAEFILIVTGIMLSFYIQEKIEDRSARKEARHILQQILSDLSSDTVRYNHEIQLAKHTIACTNYLLNLNYETQLDTEEELDSAIICFWAATFNIKTFVYTAGYTRLIHFDNKSIINDDSLMNSIIGYYTIDKAIIDGFMKFDADFVDGPLTQAYTEPYSYDILNADYQHNLLKKPYSTTIKEDFILFLENKKIRSMLIFNVSNKEYIKKKIQTTRDSASEKINLLKNWLAKS